MTDDELQQAKVICDAATLGLCGSNAAGVICGCNKRFVTRDEIYRCVDCGVEFHKHCAREHFAKSGDNFLLAKEDAQLEARELRLDVRDLRAEVERMRPVYEAAKALRPKLPSTHRCDRWPAEEADLADAVDTASRRSHEEVTVTDRRDADKDGVDRAESGTGSGTESGTVGG